jgi:hypothetical protein
MGRPGVAQITPGLCRVPGHGTLSKEIFIFFKKILCRVPRVLALGKGFFAEYQDWHLAIFFIFWPYFFWGLYTVIKFQFQNLDNFEFFYYISLIIFISLNFFDYFKFELQVHGIIKFGHSKMVFMMFSVC